MNLSIAILCLNWKEKDLHGGILRFGVLKIYGLPPCKNNGPLRFFYSVFVLDHHLAPVSPSIFQTASISILALANNTIWMSSHSNGMIPLYDFFSIIDTACVRFAMVFTCMMFNMNPVCQCECEKKP